MYHSTKHKRERNGIAFALRIRGHSFFSARASAAVLLEVGLGNEDSKNPWRPAHGPPRACIESCGAAAIVALTRSNRIGSESIQSINHSIRRSCRSDRSIESGRREQDRDWGTRPSSLAPLSEPIPLRLRNKLKLPVPWRGPPNILPRPCRSSGTHDQASKVGRGMPPFPRPEALSHFPFQACVRSGEGVGVSEWLADPPLVDPPVSVHMGSTDSPLSIVEEGEGPGLVPRISTKAAPGIGYGYEGPPPPSLVQALGFGLPHIPYPPSLLQAFEASGCQAPGASRCLLGRPWVWWDE